MYNITIMKNIFIKQERNCSESSMFCSYFWQFAENWLFFKFTVVLESFLKILEGARNLFQHFELRRHQSKRTNVENKRIIISYDL